MSGCDPSVVLALNSGSSSLKFGLYRAGASHVEILVSGNADLAGGGKGQFHADDSHGTPLVREATSFADQGAAIVRIARLLADTGQTAPAAVGHRVVHGGPQLRRHRLIDAAVLRKLEAQRPSRRSISRRP